MNGGLLLMWFGGFLTGTGLTIAAINLWRLVRDRLDEGDEW